MVLRSNSVTQIEQVLAEIYNLSEISGNTMDMEEITSQTHSAIEAVRNGQRWVDLPPRHPACAACSMRSSAKRN